jgi:dTDP-4-dehydrorhamnose 3,5-epimerase
MEFVRQVIPDLILIKPTLFNDERGYFFESYREDLLSDFVGHRINFIQDNESKSSFGTLRGLHYQMPPFAQTKLVRVVQGSVLDIAVDLRKNSPHFGKYQSFELNDNNKYQLLIPKGFAHGFVVLTNEAIFSYKVDNYYNSALDKGIRFDDPSLAIDWTLSLSELTLSEKDLDLPFFDSQSEFFD